MKYPYNGREYRLTRIQVSQASGETTALLAGVAGSRICVVRTYLRLAGATAGLATFLSGAGPTPVSPQMSCAQASPLAIDPPVGSPIAETAVGETLSINTTVALVGWVWVIVVPTAEFVS